MSDESWYRQIHERLLSADPTAPAELAREVWPPLLATLKRSHPRLRGSDFLQDAAADALMSYIKRPDQYDSGKRGFFGYLVMAAEGDLRNALKKAGRQRRGAVRLDDVELEAARGNRTLGKKLSKMPDLDAPLDLRRAQEALDRLFPDMKDRQAAELMLSGERSTKEFARLWGLGGIPSEQQRREVKRNKDRIKKALERWREGARRG